MNLYNHSIPRNRSRWVQTGEIILQEQVIFGEFIVIEGIAIIVHPFGSKDIYFVKVFVKAGIGRWQTQRTAIDIGQKERQPHSIDQVPFIIFQISVQILVKAIVIVIFVFLIQNWELLFHLNYPVLQMMFSTDGFLESLNFLFVLKNLQQNGIFVVFVCFFLKVFSIHFQKDRVSFDLIKPVENFLYFYFELSNFLPCFLYFLFVKLYCQFIFCYLFCQYLLPHLQNIQLFFQLLDRIVQINQNDRIFRNYFSFCVCLLRVIGDCFLVDFYRFVDGLQFLFQFIIVFINIAQLDQSFSQFIVNLKNTNFFCLPLQLIIFQFQLINLVLSLFIYFVQLIQLKIPFCQPNIYHANHFIKVQNLISTAYLLVFLVQPFNNSFQRTLVRIVYHICKLFQVGQRIKEAIRLSLV